MGMGELRRLKQSEEENRKLMQPVADLNLDELILQDVPSKDSKAWPATGTGTAPRKQLWGERATRLQHASIQTFFTSLPVDCSRPGRSAHAHQGDRGDTSAQWLVVTIGFTFCCGDTRGP